MPNVPVKDFSRGLDNFAARSNIKEGYSESLLNVDVSPAGYIETRKGYQGYYGHLPVRVVSAEHDGTDIIFTLDSSIDLTTAVKGPLVVYGKLSSAQTDGDFTNTATGMYYPAWTIGGSNNKLVVADITEDEVDYTDNSPQLTIWGLGNIAGYAQHVDVFRRPLEERVVVGTGGHFYAARTHAEGADTYLIGTPIPPLGASTATEIGHVFHPPTYPTAAMGVKDASCVDYKARVTGATFGSYFAGRNMRIWLSFDNATSVPSSAGNYSPRYTVSGMPYSILNGEFEGLRPTVTSPTEGYVELNIPGITDSRYDVSGCDGRVSAYGGTIGNHVRWGELSRGDGFTTAAGVQFELNPILTSLILSVAAGPELGTTIIGPIYPRRTSKHHRLRNLDGVVIGDMVRLSTQSQLARVVQVFNNPDGTGDTGALRCTYTWSGNVVTITFPHDVALSVGQSIYITSMTGVSSAEVLPYALHPIVSKISESVYTVASGPSTTASGFIDVAQQLVIFDEEVLVEADTTMEVVGRWIPIEAPADSGFAVPKALPAASAATRVRSVMAQDNMYLTSYTAAVVKFDGENIYDAGLPRWRPHLFAMIDTSVEAIPLTAPRINVMRPKSAGFTSTDVDTTDNEITSADHNFVTGEAVRLTTSGTLPTGVTTSTTYYVIRVSEDVYKLASSVTDALAGTAIDLSAAGSGASTMTAINISTMTLPAGAVSFIRIGSKISYTGQNTLLDDIYTVLDVQETTTSDVLFLDKNIPSEWTTTDFIQGVDTYRYYARLNLVDANNNIIASAATGSEDIIVELTASGQIVHKLIRPPFLGNLNYARIEVELYRTKANTVGPYYLVYRALVNYDATSPYIEAVDARPDVSLFEQDSINVALLGAELGTTWDMPPQARHTTAVDGRLVLANLVDKQRAKLTIRPAPSYGTLTPAQLSGLKVELRAEAGDTSPALTFEFTNSNGVAGAGSLVRADDGDHVLVNMGNYGGATAFVGKYIYLGYALGTYDKPASDDLAGWFKVVSVDGTNSDWGRIESAALLPEIVIDAASDVDPATDRLTIPAHGLTTGDYIFLYMDTPANAPVGLVSDVAFHSPIQVTVVDVDTVEVPIDITAAGTGDMKVTRAYVFGLPHSIVASSGGHVPVYLGIDSNYIAMPKLYENDSSIERLAAVRLSHAINAVTAHMSASGASHPYWLAEAGGEFGVGECNISNPQAIMPLFSIAVTDIPSRVNVYINDVQRAEDEEVSAAQRLFPSRLVASYANFPEIFDNPYGTPQTSDSAIDVGAADGQEITGVMPFFGASTSGGSQLGSTVVVFKTASVYLVDVASKQVQRIPGNLGCTAPHSIVATPSGIMFANESGIYILTQDMKVRPAGRMIQTFWRERVSKAALSEAYGTYYALRRQYKLSVPVDGSATNNYVLVYNQEKEGDGQEYGAWTFYDNHPATGWANLSDDAVFSATDGQVFSLRKLEEASDYRDDGDAISSQEIILRAEDFGAPGLRKRIRNFFLEIDASLTGIANLVVKLAADLSSTFEEAGTIGELGSEEGLRFASPASKAKYVQLKISHSGKDKCLLLTGVSYNVDGLSAKGTKEQADV